AIDDFPDPEEAAALINRMDRVNRVLVEVWTAAKLSEMRTTPQFLSKERLDRLRRADAIVRRLTHASGFDREVWQFPVVLSPFGTADEPDSVVLRPIDS